MKKFVLIIVIAFRISLSYSQSLEPTIVSNSGGYYQGATVSLSFTVGEPIIETYSNEGLILTQGFQQSEYIIDNIEELSNGDYLINVYPNPSNDIINIEYINSGEDIMVELYDALGRKLFSKEIKNNETQSQMDLKSYSSAEYFLRFFTKSGKLVQTFKIIKR